MDAFGLEVDMGFAIVVVVVVVANVTWVVGLATVTVLHWFRKLKIHDDARLQRVLAPSVHRTRNGQFDRITQVHACC